MKRIIATLAVLVVLVGIAAGAAVSAGVSWSNLRLTNEVKNLKVRVNDMQANIDSLDYQHTQRELRILACVKKPEAEEAACVDSLDYLGATDPTLRALVP